MSYTRQQKREMLRRLNDKAKMTEQVKKIQEATDRELSSKLEESKRRTRIAATVTIIVLVGLITAMALC